MGRHFTAEDCESFALAYLKHLNISAAARELGLDRWAGQRLMQHPDVQDLINAGKAERIKTLKAEGLDVVRELHNIAFADVNELMEWRIESCRYCHGLDHKHQYTTERELKDAERKYERTVEALVEPLDHGGIGFDPTRPPHPDCPECHGEGVGRAVVKDTRHLSPAARALYAGVKVTKDGIEVKTHSKEKALENLGRHLSLFTDTLKLDGGTLVERLLGARKRAGS